MTLQQRKPLAFGLSLLVLVAILLSFPGVRAAASDFLGLFRVQKFAAVSVSPEQIALLEQVAEEGLTPGEFNVVQDPGEPTPVGNVGEAAARTGLDVRTLPILGRPLEVSVTNRGEGAFIVNLEGARAIVAAAGADPNLLPDSLDGAQVDVTIFPGVQQAWSDVMLLQAESPQVAYPDDVDTAVLGEALLQVLGTPAEEAQRIARSIDWTSTLLLPIPQEAATYREVTVNGVSGVAVKNVSGAETALLWQQDGVIYMLAGNRGVSELLDLAATLE